MMRKNWIAILLALALMLSLAALAEDHSQVADAADMADVIDVVEEGMVPVTADQLNDGVYEVAVDSSSSMFKVVGCELTVEGGAMTAKLFMKSEAYSYMYAGSAEEASQADEADLAALAQEGDSLSFTLPVDALDAGFECAAFSDRKQAWYPRTLLFRSDSLPAGAWSEAGLATVESLGLADGEYTVEAVLEGGRATVESPAALTVEGGIGAVRLAFSTSKIDYVIVDGEKYLPENTEGNAVFTVPVEAFDRKLSIIVDSTAIKPATEVQYTITFDSTTISGK